MAEDPPGGALRRRGHHMQTPTDFGWRLVAFRMVTPGAGGYHIVPLVTTSPASGEDVVDGLRGTTAVGAPAAVAGEDGPAGQPDVRPVRHPDEAGEPHHQRHGQVSTLTVQDAVAIGQTDGLGG